MATSRFQAAVEKEIQAAKDGMVSLSLGDALNHARLKGMIEGLAQAISVYREVIRQDEEQELE